MYRNGLMKGERNLESKKVIKKKQNVKKIVKISAKTQSFVFVFFSARFQHTCSQWIQTI